MRATTTPFVGRRHEMHDLRGWLDEARGGRGRVVMLRGEAGIGKTRLVEELAAVAADQGVPVAWGRCPADAGAPPMWPMRRVLDQIGGDGPRVATTEETYGESSEGSTAARFAQLVRVADAVVDAGADAGLLVIVEDLHWADDATVSALAHLAAEVPRSCVLVVVTSRARLDPDEERLAPLLERPGCEHRQLPALVRSEISEYLDAATGGPVDGRYVDLVLRQSAGNSLYVTAVTRLLREHGSLRHYDARASLAALAGRPELTDLVRGPLGRLSARCRRVLEAASVAGEEFRTAELASACDLPFDAITAALNEASASRLLTLPGDAPDTARFVHALVRDGVYDTIDRGMRRRLHLALAETAIAADDAHARVGEVAFHLARGAATAADHLCAADWAGRAGRAALKDLASTDAVVWFRSALECLALGGVPSGARRADAQLDLAFAMYRSGAFGGALDQCLAAADAAERLGRWDVLARAALLVDGVSPPDEGAQDELCRRALVLVPDAQTSLRAQLGARLAYTAAERGDLAGAGQLSATALVLAEGTEDPAALLAALRARHKALAGPGFAAERLALGRRAIDLAGSGEPLAALWGRLWRVDASFELCNLVAVDSELAELALLSAELRFPLARWHLARLRAARESMVGRFAVAQGHAETARGLAEQMEDASLVPLSHAFSLFIHYVRGEGLTDLGHDVELRDFLSFAAQVRVPVALTSAATLRVISDEADEAARMARRLCAEAPGWPRDGSWIVAVAMLADVVADVGDPDGARVLYPLLEPFAALGVAGGAGAVACDGSVSRHLGRLAAMCGRLADAERHLRDAISLEERLGARPFAAMSRMYLARVLRERGGGERLVEAAGTARAALAAMEAMGMAGRAAQCRALLLEIGTDHEVSAPLTPREAEIVALVAGGASNRQVAERLVVSERTVETHVSHVLAKIGGSKRSDIVRWALTRAPTSPHAQKK